ncbi:MAG: arsenate reductase ArsC [Betaproteobacteria bacterium]
MSAPVTRHVLFLCTANSARSILAEGLMNALGGARGFRAWSAGSFPRGEVNPLALRTLAEQGIPVDGFRSKSWEEFAGPRAPVMDFVFTVCDQAAGELCPVWPGQPVTAHWGVPDPAAVEGVDAVRMKAFLEAFLTLRRRIEIMLSLPIPSLDRMLLQQRVREIGGQ